ncbi:MAG: hypothetical protein ACRDKB_00950 [Actinomycetota bacterium]
MRRSEVSGLLVLLMAGVIAAASLMGLTLLPLLMFLGGALAVLGALDAALHSDSSWKAADQNKVVWVGFQLVGLAIFLIPGFVAAIAYFTLVRPKLSSRSPVA